MTTATDTCWRKKGCPLANSLDRLVPIAGRTADRTRTELDSTLNAVARSQIGSRAWSASGLTATGFPVELAISSASAELRTVVEVVAPEDDRRKALPAALDLAADHGSSGWSDHMMGILADHLSTFVPRFGAWLGSRHLEDSSRHKVYVEVDQDRERAWALLDRLAPDARSIIGGFGPIRFIGVHLDRPDAIEIYLRPPIVHPWQVQTCLTRAGLGQYADPLVSALFCVEQADQARPKPRPVHGLSLAFEDGAASAVAGFTFASHRYGPDHKIRSQTLATAIDQDWPSASLYAALSEPLAAPSAARALTGRQPAAGQPEHQDPPFLPPIHTVLSDVAAAGSPSLHHHVGLAPANNHQS